MKTRLRQNLLSTAILLSLSVSTYAEIGHLNVQSYLNEPLAAYFTVTGEDAKSVLENSKNIKITGIAGALSTHLVKQGENKVVVQIKSQQLIRDPITNIDIVLGQNKRKFQLLMDPRGNTQGQEQVTKKEGEFIIEPINTRPQRGVVKGISPVKEKPVIKSYNNEATLGATYQVQEDDTVISLARLIQPEGVTLAQTMRAIVIKNKKAIRNPNILHKDTVIRLPASKSEIIRLSRKPVTKPSVQVKKPAITTDSAINKTETVENTEKLITENKSQIEEKVASEEGQSLRVESESASELTIVENTASEEAIVEEIEATETRIEQTPPTVDENTTLVVPEESEFDWAGLFPYLGGAAVLLLLLLLLLRRKTKNIDTDDNITITSDEFFVEPLIIDTDDQEEEKELETSLMQQMDEIPVLVESSSEQADESTSSKAYSSYIEDIEDIDVTLISTDVKDTQEDTMGATKINSMDDTLKFVDFNEFKGEPTITYDSFVESTVTEQPVALEEIKVNAEANISDGLLSEELQISKEEFVHKDSIEAQLANAQEKSLSFNSDFDISGLDFSLDEDVDQLDTSLAAIDGSEENLQQVETEIKLQEGSTNADAIDFVVPDISESIIQPTIELNKEVVALSEEDRAIDFVETDIQIESGVDVSEATVFDDADKDTKEKEALRAKLDLARMYLDGGNQDGAVETLYEILDAVTADSDIAIAANTLLSTIDN